MDFDGDIFSDWEFKILILRNNEKMEHIMNLNPSPFFMIKDGTKTIELRLYDEKRRQILVGDTIRFINTNNLNDTFRARVIDIYVFDTFDDLYKELPLMECGYTENDIHEASPKDMEEYYSIERQIKYSVVGIRVKLI